MSSENQVLAEINRHIEQLPESERLAVAAAEGAIRRALEAHFPWGQLALAKVGAEISLGTIR